MPRLRVQVGGLIAASSSWSNTTEYALSGTITSFGTLQTIANALQANLSASAAYKAALGTDTTTVSPKLLYYPDGSTVATIVAEGAGASFAGTVSPVHAPQVCVVASIRTDFAGRSARGRTYVPYRGSNISAGGVVNATGAGLVIAYENALKSAVVAACASSSVTAAWGVYSPKQAVMRTPTAILVGSQADTVRHRVRNRAETYTSGTITATALVAQSDEDNDLFTRIASSGTRVPFQQALGDAPAFLQSLIDVIPFEPEGESADQAAGDAANAPVDE